MYSRWPVDKPILDIIQAGLKEPIEASRWIATRSTQPLIHTVSRPIFWLRRWIWCSRFELWAFCV